jgi:hypothetical protein
VANASDWARFFVGPKHFDSFAGWDAALRCLDRFTEGLAKVGWAHHLKKNLRPGLRVVATLELEPETAGTAVGNVVDKAATD